MEHLTPGEIVKELDKYIIGQHEAKRTVAIALRNRWRRMQTDPSIQKDIMPNNILMIGSTGIGKTEIARRLAKLVDAPFVKVEASKYTEVGYVGRDVESMVRDLAEQSVLLVKSMRKETVKEKAMAQVEEIILDALIPPTPAPDMSFKKIDEQEEIQKEKTRQWFRDKLVNKEIEDKKIEINIQSQASPNIGVMGPIGVDESSMQNLQDMLGGMMPKKSKKRKVTIAEARKILLEEEVAKLIDMDEVKEEAIHRAENLGIIFIDEIDKIAKSNRQSGSGDVSREGVQRDLLPIVEGSAVNTKYGILHTDHILFIAAGAFHFSKPSDLIPELQGRFPIRAELEKLKTEDFERILKEPKNALSKQYQALFQAEGVSLEFEPLTYSKLAEIAFAVNEQVENIGARRLQTIMAQLLQEFLFDIPEKIPSGARIVITPALVEEKLGHLVKDKDLSQFIL